ncbi:MAG TPA: metallo-mystery pair system four-Cys motif protein [Pyrinomonadaceae bacterium]|mgnify:CR=1 FL=1|nr:metallo-mystery pair system four-Cys motif protein [Pyrinomonadaceae bacterium]
MISDKYLCSLVFVLLLSGVVFSQAQQPITINLAAAVDGKQFNCSETYNGIGTTGSTMTVSDFRFYVHDVRLVDKKGKETSVSLTNDGKFQSERVALIDFEDGTGACKNGTADLNTTIRGAVPKGKYVGLKFKIGVPQDLNHLDPSKASAPLNVTRMMWSWQSGYKFARIDTKTTGRPNGYVLHLGSSDCKTDTSTNVTTCGHANRPEFSFVKFDLARDVATIDLKALFAGADVDTNQEKTASGCMSFDGDADCAPVFGNLGLPFAGTAARDQSVFSIKRMPTVRASVSEKRR